MRWKDMTGPERYRVVEMARRGERPLVEICRTFEVSRQTLHKAMERVEQAAMEALEPQTPGRKGPSEEQLLIGELEKKTTGLEKQVEILNKRVDVNAVLAGVHGSIALVTNPAIIRSFPHSLMESLAAGKPVIVSRSIPMSDYVEQTGCERNQPLPARPG